LKLEREASRSDARRTTLSTLSRPCETLPIMKREAARETVCRLDDYTLAPALRRTREVFEVVRQIPLREPSALRKLTQAQRTLAQQLCDAFTVGIAPG
jgi:hypothetical protein